MLSVFISFCVLSAPSLRADTAAGYAAFDGGRYGEAAREWRAAAEAGDAEAQVALAGLYELGMGVPGSARAALRWYRAAARQGQVAAQLNLGDYLARGVATERDPVAAWMWLELAARQGNEWSAARRDELAGTMTAAEIETARARAAAFKPGVAE